jgi:hypothetical protein
LLEAKKRFGDYIPPDSFKEWAENVFHSWTQKQSQQQGLKGH